MPDVVRDVQTDLGDESIGVSHNSDGNRDDKITAADLDYVNYYEKSSLKIDRLIKTCLMYAPKGLGSFLKALPIWVKEKLWLEQHIRKELGFKGPLFCPDLMTIEPDGAWFYQQLELGFNHRMTDIHAVLGLSQLERLDAFLE